MSASRHSLFIRKLASSFGLTVGGVGLGYVSQVFIARWLRADGYGEYSLLVTWVTLLAIPCSLGLGLAALRFIPEYSALSKPQEASGFLRAALRLCFAASCLGGIVFAAWGCSVGKDPLSASFAGGALVAFTLLSASAEICRAHGSVLRAYLGLKLFRPLLMIVGVAILSAAAVSAKPSVAITLFLTVVSLLCALQLTIMVVVLPKETRRAPPKYAVRQWLAVSFPLMLIASSTLALDRIGILTVGVFCSTTDVAHMMAASTTATLAAFIFRSVNVIVAPEISRLYASGDMQALSTYLRSSAHWFCWPTVALAVLMIAFRNTILSIYGTTFSNASSALVILTIAHLWCACTGPVGFLLTLTGRERITVAVMTQAFLLSVTLTALLVPWAGINGAALAALATMIFWNIRLHRLAVRHLGVSPSILTVLRKGRTANGY